MEAIAQRIEESKEGDGQNEREMVYNLQSSKRQVKKK